MIIIVIIKIKTTTPRWFLLLRRDTPREESRPSGAAAAGHSAVPLAAHRQGRGTRGLGDPGAVGAALLGREGHRPPAVAGHGGVRGRVRVRAAEGTPGVPPGWSPGCLQGCSREVWKAQARCGRQRETDWGGGGAEIGVKGMRWRKESGQEGRRGRFQDQGSLSPGHPRTGL